jgi:hypothetical protein
MGTRAKTISKHFFDDQIEGITYDSNGKKEIHLKMGVRKRYNPGYIDYEDCSQRIGLLDTIELYKQLNIKLFGEHETEYNDDYN